MPYCRTWGYHLFRQHSTAHANSKINPHKPIIFAVTVHNCPIYTWLSHFDRYKLVTVLSEHFILFFPPEIREENILCHNFKYDWEGFTFPFASGLIIGNHQNNIYLWRQHMIYCADYHLSCLSMGEQGRWTFQNRIRLPQINGSTLAQLHISPREEKYIIFIITVSPFCPPHAFYPQYNNTFSNHKSLIYPFELSKKPNFKMVSKPPKRGLYVKICSTIL